MAGDISWWNVSNATWMTVMSSCSVLRLRSIGISVDGIMWGTWQPIITASYYFNICFIIGDTRPCPHRPRPCRHWLDRINKHTIRGSKTIIAITRTRNTDDYMVCVDRERCARPLHSIRENHPQPCRVNTRYDMKARSRRLIIYYWEEGL